MCLFICCLHTLDKSEVLQARTSLSMISCVAFRLRRKQNAHSVTLSVFLRQVKVKGSWKLQIHAAPVCYHGFILEVRLDLTSNWKKLLQKLPLGTPRVSGLLRLKMRMRKCVQDGESHINIICLAFTCPSPPSPLLLRDL